ncbi:hypothetical protein [Nocardia sp. R6R-6]|uniref:hypothetical protein n=1 Tax=Nocardia sp. R6R-6 TaxID=3459303 RepID=UPI00403E3059
MTSEGDAREDDSGRPGSDFGPPLGEFGPPLEEFGPPVSDFGPPVSEFGPPMGADTGPSWQVPQQPTDHPELIWRPAGEAAPTAPSQQFRAPDATVYAEQPAAPERPAAEPARPQSTGGERDSWWSQPTAEGGVPKPPPTSESDLSWAKDPIAMRLAPRVPATPSPAESSGSSRRWVVVGSIAAVVVLIALTVTIIGISRGGDDGGDPTAAPGPSAPVLDCQAKTEGNVTIGNSPGDTSSGIRAILGFEHAYYAERSAARAHTFVTPQTNIQQPQVMQPAIDREIPPGTAYCLRIESVGPDLFNVDLTERRPNGVTTVYRQTIATVQQEDRHLISTIFDR